MNEPIAGELMPVPIIRKPTDLMPLAEGVVSDAKDVSIETREDYTRISGLVSELKGRWNRIDAERRRLKKPLDEFIAGFQDFFNVNLLHPLAEAEGILKGKLIEFKQAEDRREQDRFRAEQAARAEAAREQERLAAEARERDAAAERARREAEQAAKGGDREAAIAAARAAMKAAKAAGAAKLAAEAQETVATLPVERAAPVKVAGQSVMKKYRFRVVDRSKVEDKWLIVNEASVQEFCDRMKDKAQEHLPGFEVTVEEIVRTRAAP